MRSTNLEQFPVTMFQNDKEFVDFIFSHSETEMRTNMLLHYPAFERFLYDLPEDVEDDGFRQLLWRQHIYVRVITLMRFQAFMDRSKANGTLNSLEPYKSLKAFLIIELIENNPDQIHYPV